MWGVPSTKPDKSKRLVAEMQVAGRALADAVTEWRASRTTGAEIKLCEAHDAWLAAKHAAQAGRGSVGW